MGLAQHFATTVVLPQSNEGIRRVVEQRPDLSGVQWVSSFQGLGQRNRSLVDRVRNRIDCWRESRLRARWTGVGHNWAFGPLSSWYEVLGDVISNGQPDIVMVEHTRHAATMAWLKHRCPRACLVVNSQNVESDLLRQIIPSAVPGKKKQNWIREVESNERNLGKYCNLLWSCSEQDQDRYKKLGVNCRNWGVVPNGVDVIATPFRNSNVAHTESRILFIGTLCYVPNEQGIAWFNRTVWPILKASVPGIKWRIVGRAPSPAVRDLAVLDGSIELYADVPSTQPHLAVSQVGICPLHSGGGTRLKILEAFSAGLPMVSTTLGAEGIDAVPSKHLKIENDPQAFADAIVGLLTDSNMAEEMRASAREFVVGKYVWEVILDQAATQLKDLLRTQNY